MAIELRPNLHYVAANEERIGVVVCVRTDESERAAYVIEDEDGNNTVLPASKTTTLSVFATLDEAQEYAYGPAESETRLP